MWRCMGIHHNNAESAERREGHLSLCKQTDITAERVSWSCVCLSAHSSCTEHWSADICSVTSQSPRTVRTPAWDWDAGAAPTRPLTHPFIAATDAVWPNRPSSPADNELWKPSPWELLHMLWVVVKETWLNNSPSHASPDSLVLRCVPALWK